jgi:hypothetical protein
MKTQSNPSVALLRDSEWVFREDTVPEWQVRFCVNYEYGRENEEFTSAVARARGRARPRRDLSGRLSFSWSTMNREFWTLRLFLAQHVPEFPATPWQEIPLQRRAGILGPIGLTEHSRLEGHGFRDHGHPQAYCEAVAKGDKFTLAHEETSYVLEFDFTETNGFIEAGFSAWLKSTHAALLACDNRPDSPYRGRRSRRGKAGNISVYYHALRQLGTFRRIRAKHPSLKELCIGEKKEGELCRMVKKRISQFSKWDSIHGIGFVESLLEKPPRSQKQS